MQRYIMKYPNGDYVGIDDMSGGYPYATKDALSAGQWETAEDAARYRKTGENPFTIHLIVGFVTAPVVEEKREVIVFVNPE